MKIPTAFIDGPRLRKIEYLNEEIDALCQERELMKMDEGAKYINLTWLPEPLHWRAVVATGGLNNVQFTALADTPTEALTMALNGFEGME